MTARGPISIFVLFSLSILKVRECYSDSEWASSDRVVLAGSDGTVRLAGLALAATSRY